MMSRIGAECCGQFFAAFPLIKAKTSHLFEMSAMSPVLSLPGKFSPLSPAFLLPE